MKHEESHFQIQDITIIWPCNDSRDTEVIELSKSYAYCAESLDVQILASARTMKFRF